jgi:hypothetical protein
MSQWTTGDVRDMLTDGLNRVFDNRGKKLAAQYPMYLRELKSETGIYIDQNVASFGMTQRKRENEGFTYDTPVFGDRLTLEARGYGLAFLVSYETLVLMAKKPHGDFSAQEFVNYKNVTQKFRDSALQRREKLAANIFLLGNSATATDEWIGAGRDGVALFGTHSTLKNPTQSFSNVRTSASLDQAELAAMVLQIMTAPSEEGFPRGMGNNLVLEVGVNQMFRAHEVIKTTKVPDSAENNDNYLNQFNFKIHVNQHLGSSNLFALIDKDQSDLVYLEPVGDTFNSDKDFETGGQRISVYHQFLPAFLSPYGAALNPGL